ncbi:MAG: prepilin-type N-terminal cleavage/methylation domain-containing protein [Lentisphaerae bacterium]|nr:prepilin-type N-terminal cleavage/methylation domain-containing protein [Lentisphaerota bacterium]
MNPRSASASPGFTLLEILFALALSAALAATVAGAIAAVSHAERVAQHYATASLHLTTLQTAQRLHPTGTPPTLPGWHIEQTPLTVQHPGSPPRQGARLTLRARGNPIPPITIQLLETSP